METLLDTASGLPNLPLGKRVGPKDEFRLEAVEAQRRNKELPILGIAPLSNWLSECGFGGAVSALGTIQCLFGEVRRLKSVRKPSAVYFEAALSQAPFHGAALAAADERTTLA